MLYQKATIKDGKLQITESMSVNQKKLTSACWAIQIEGKQACELCELRGTDDCGGKELIK